MLCSETFEGLAEKRLLKLCESFKIDEGEREGGEDHTNTQTDPYTPAHTIKATC